jgi:predicted O-linked N-acetylglucosamine transferase (SPINDLY family)
MAEPAGVEELLSIAQGALIAHDVRGAQAALDQLPSSTDDDPLVGYIRAAALFAAGDVEGAEAVLARARNLHVRRIVQAAGGDLDRLSTDPAYAVEVGRRFYNAKQMAPAAAAFAYAAAIHGPLMLTALQLHAEALHYEGRVDEAATAFAAVFRLEPTPQRHSFFLYSLFFVADGVRRHAEEARNWARLWANDALPPRPCFALEPHGGRPLRVGYVAPSFTVNQTRQFMHPLLSAHDPKAVEIFLYVEAAEQERAPPHIHLRSTRGVEPDEIAQQIRRDRIDILVDVWGHAARNILQVFGRKPAPVQISWLNYMQTTGLAAMDYVLHGDFMDAPGKVEAFNEAICDLGPVTGLFQPDPQAMPSPSPALARGYVTFASFNHPAKISAATLAAWARILKACPTARLKFKYAPFSDPVLQAQFQARFLAHGVAPEHLQFEGHGQGADYERAFSEIDLALDPSPCPGGTTTLEAFSRGVPVLTLDGQDFYARIGVQPLMAIGLRELIAHDWDDYVARAVELAQDIPRLAQLRAEIRARFDASPYQDAPGFARRLEATYRRLFEKRLIQRLDATGKAA